jgi:hypothetical protein
MRVTVSKKKAARDRSVLNKNGPSKVKKNKPDSQAVASVLKPFVDSLLGSSKKIKIVMEVTRHRNGGFRIEATPI